MKNATEMRTEVVARLENILQNEEVSLETVDIVKLNDIFQYGILFRTGDFGRTLYVNDFMEEWKSANDIADEMLAAYMNSVEAPPYDMVEDMQANQPLSVLSENLFVAMLEVSRNESYLKDIPCQEVGHGFAYICQIRYMDPSGNGCMSATVTRALAESNGWDIEELFRMAISNTLKNDAPMLYNMGSALMGISENILDEEGYGAEEMLVLTNANQMFGAASLFLPGVIDKIHACLGCGFYAIPSSIHEVIIVPESADIHIEQLSAMCKEANATIVEKKEVLSDHVMFFKR